MEKLVNYISIQCEIAILQALFRNVLHVLFSLDTLEPLR